MQKFDFLAMLKVKGSSSRHLHRATYRKTRTAAAVYNSKWGTALAVGGAAQLAAAHCRNERSLQFDRPIYTPQPAELWFSQRNLE